jgi:thiosulfate/3-mercaptopyruvate sulfurtransferase
MTDRGPFIISADALHDLLGKPQVRIVDASWYLPAQNRDAKSEYIAQRIPGAVFFDIDTICDRQSALPHMMPDAETFSSAASELGISESDHIIIYDGPGLFSAARVWWMFRVMGARQVQILDGGFDRWKATKKPVETGPPPPVARSQFNAIPDFTRIADIGDIRKNLKTGDVLVLDARPYARFTGQTAEPRPGLRSGHIPGSLSLPFDTLTENGSLKNIDALRKIFDEFPLTNNRPLITSCGSGVTAAVISLALESIGHDRHALYDGSWAEWGQADNAPVARWDEDGGKSS